MEELKKLLDFMEINIDTSMKIVVIKPKHYSVNSKKFLARIYNILNDIKVLKQEIPQEIWDETNHIKDIIQTLLVSMIKQVENPKNIEVFGKELEGILNHLNGDKTG